MKVDSPVTSLMLLRGTLSGLALSLALSAPMAQAQEDDLFAVDQDQAETIPVNPAERDSAAVSDAVDKGATKLDAVEVTGSRIKRTDYETAQPILVLTREDIAKTGLVSIGDILQNLPQAGAALSRAFNNGGNGATEIDLRNLGSNRVLVLVNGRRWINGVSQFNTSGVDLNTIPVSIIETIEILKDGASAIYGSDAMAGVVNIKTRRDFIGAEVRGHGEATTQGDGITQQVGFSAGTVSGNTSIFLDISYVSQGEVLSGDRAESSVPTFGSGTSRGSRFTPNTNTIVVPTNQNENAWNTVAGTSPTTPTSVCYDITTALAEDDDTGELPPIPVGSGVTICDATYNPAQQAADGTLQWERFDQNTNSYNFAPINYLLTPQERTGIFSQLSHQLTDTVRLTTEVLFNIRKSTQQLAQTPMALGDAFGRFHPFDLGYVAADNPYNPFNSAGGSNPYYIPGSAAQDIGRGDPGGGLVGLGAVLRRFTELGPRIFSQDVTTWRVGGGFDGSFDVADHFFAWDAGYTFGENRLENISNGLIDSARAARASGPIADCIGVVDENTGEQITARPPIAAECVPLNWFGGAGSVTQEMLDYIAYTAIDVNQQRQRAGYANISTEFDGLGFLFPAPIGIAFGGEVREEFFRGVPDPLKANLTSSTNHVQPTVGEYTVSEGYVEMNVPLLSGKTFDDIGLGNVAWLQGVSLVDELDINMAGRYSDYTGFGTNTSGKLGLRYKPTDNLMFRATYSDSFRAPAITDLYLGQATSYPSVADPCDAPAAERTDNENANCEPGDNQVGSQVPTVFGGNPDLTPETAETYSFGMVWSPQFIQDFNVYADWYRIDAVDFISPLGPAQALALCYSAPPEQRSYCDRIHRSDTGVLESIDAVFTNFGGLTVEGVDFNIDWILPFDALRDYGQFKVVMDAAYVSKFDVTSPSPGGDTTVGLVGLEFGGGGAVPRWKVNSSLNWTMGVWDAAWNVRYIHSLVEPCDDGRSDPGTAVTGNVLSNPTQVLSWQEYGMCSQDYNARVEGPANKLDATFYNDVQLGYSLPGWNSRLVFGVLNVLDQDPPLATSAFSDSFDKATHEFWGSRSPYLRYQLSF